MSGNEAERRLSSIMFAEHVDLKGANAERKCTEIRRRD
jgi:hypothetical protein